MEGLTSSDPAESRGLFGCEILFHDACAVRQFGMRDEVRHPTPPRVWRHDIIFCQNVAWRTFVMRAALSVKCGAGYRSTPGAKWRIRRLHNILRKCSAKYYAVRMRVTLYVVWGHIQQNIISQPNRPQGLWRRSWALPSDRDIPGERQNLDAKV